MPLTKDMIFPSKWLKAVEDGIPATGVDVTIEDVTSEEVDFGDGPKIAANVKFVEYGKPLSLNATNWDSIEQLHGPDAERWAGKRVRLFQTKCRNKGGQLVPCIRIQPSLGGAAPAAAPATGTDAIKQTWAKFYVKLSKAQQEQVPTILGGSPMSWMTKTGKDVAACISFVTVALQMPVEADAPPPDDIPFD